MRIFNLNVSGDLTLNAEFKEKNILLGENNTGKSTFVKLLLYSLGVNINNFIDEIAKDNKCNSVSIAIQTKSNNKYLITIAVLSTSILMLMLFLLILFSRLKHMK